MKKLFVAPFVFTTIAAISLAGAPAATADEGDPAVAVWLSEPSASTLTLPAGDGVRDVASIEVGATAATTVALRLIDRHDAAVIRELPSIELTDAEGLSGTVTLSLDGITTAGQYALEAAPTSGEAASAEFTVGSGKPQAAALTLNRDLIYTYKGAKVRTVDARVSARDETGLAVPFTGTVVATVGTKKATHKVASTTGASTKTTIAGSSLAPGTAKVVFTATAQGASATAKDSVLVKNFAVTKTSIKASERTLYPTKDGYLDATRFTVSTATTTGTTVAASGSVKVTRGGKTVASWKLTSSKKWSAAWNGKVNGKVVPGTYTVKASVKGPEGATKTASTTVTVKAGKLVAKKSVKTVKAKSVLDAYVDLGSSDYNWCATDAITPGDVYCDGEDSLEGVSVVGVGETAVPAAVVKAEKFGGAKVRITAKVTRQYGATMFGYWRSDSDAGKTTYFEETGSHSAGWLTLPATTKKLDVALALGEYSATVVDEFTIEYSYKVMTK